MPGGRASSTIPLSPWCQTKLPKDRLGHPWPFPTPMRSLRSACPPPARDAPLGSQGRLLHTTPARPHPRAPRTPHSALWDPPILSLGGLLWGLAASQAPKGYARRCRSALQAPGGEGGRDGEEFSSRLQEGSEERAGAGRSAAAAGEATGGAATATRSRSAATMGRGGALGSGL